MQEVSKIYYKITDVASLLGEATSTVRFWEEQKLIKAPRARDKQDNRKYKRDEVYDIVLFHFFYRKAGFQPNYAKNIVKYLRIICNLLNK